MFGLTRSPELQAPGLTWFNVDGPLCLSAMRGQIILLDFWTYCCVNCMHVLPTLKRIEEAFEDQVRVIGVHSPKFSAERDPDNLAHAIARYGISHAVVHDPGFYLWDQYAIRAWPTLVLIAPNGYIVGVIEGEPNADRLIDGLGTMVRDQAETGTIAPLNFASAPSKTPKSSLCFPSKIKRLPTQGGGKQWAVSDANHHQIVVFDDEGHEIRRYGCGSAGFTDGPGDTARFNQPQGLACDDRSIFVADTGNHAIRKIDRETGFVLTQAGTGERGAILGEPSAARSTALSSVWDLVLDGERVYFANAGTHQLGFLDVETGTLSPIAGSGIEGIQDGPALDAHLAQPSGLAMDGKARRLYFVDSETSAVRYLSLGKDPQVTTLVGEGLFEFGHINGPFETSRMQHPLGLCLWEGKIVVADSYNARLRVLDLVHGHTHDLGETAFANADGLCLPAGEPAGVTSDGPDRLLMVDTNNHRILEIRPKSGLIRTWTGSVFL